MVSTRLSPGVNKIEMNMAFLVKIFNLRNPTDLFIYFAYVCVCVCASARSPVCMHACVRACVCVCVCVLMK